MGYPALAPIYATQLVEPDNAGYITGSIPLDMNLSGPDILPIIEASIWLIPDGADPEAEFAADIDLMVANIGELYNAYSISGSYVWSLTPGQIYRHDMKLLFGSDPMVITPGSIFGVAVSSSDDNILDIHLVGFRLRYTIRFPDQAGLAVIREDFWTCQVLGGRGPG